jgi:hypothetical protein
VFVAPVKFACANIATRVYAQVANDTWCTLVYVKLLPPVYVKACSNITTRSAATSLEYSKWAGPTPSIGKHEGEKLAGHCTLGAPITDDGRRESKRLQEPSNLTTQNDRLTRDCCVPNDQAHTYATCLCMDVNVYRFANN